VAAAAGRTVDALTTATATPASRWRASSMVPPGQVDQNAITIPQLRVIDQLR
jgi:hypothetical protein